VSTGLILAGGIVLLAAAALGLAIARRAGEDLDPRRPGHELDAAAPATPAARRHVGVAMGMAVALAVLGAALAGFLLEQSQP
jgi:hypothetical protein